VEPTADMRPPAPPCPGGCVARQRTRSGPGPCGGRNIKYADRARDARGQRHANVSTRVEGFILAKSRNAAFRIFDASMVAAQLEFMATLPFSNTPGSHQIARLARLSKF
jgi:hypothetical protein